MEEQLFSIVIFALLGILYLYHFFLLVIIFFRVNVLHKIIKTSYGASIKALIGGWAIISFLVSVIIVVVSVAF